MFFIARATAPTLAAPAGRTSTTRQFSSFIPGVFSSSSSCTSRTIPTTVGIEIRGGRLPLRRDTTAEA
jgi:hypothetical protein